MQKNHGPEFWNSNSLIFENFLKFSIRRRTVPLRPIWTIMVAAKLDHSRVLVTKFHQNRSTLKVEVQVRDAHTHTHRQTERQTDRQTDKPVGFYGPIAPPVPNAPSLECSRASIAACRHIAGSHQASCCCSSAIAGITIGANFKIYLLR